MTKNGLTWFPGRSLKVRAVPLLIASQMAMISTAMFSIIPAYAMEGGKLPLTIERMNASPALAGTSPRGLKLSPDGQRVTYLTGRKDNQNFYDLWQMDVRVVSWKGLFALFGARPGYQLDSIQGRYLALEHERSRERTRHGIHRAPVVFDIHDGAFHLVELAPDVTLDEVRAKTAGKLVVH